MVAIFDESKNVIKEQNTFDSIMIEQQTFKPERKLLTA
jgi:hypothetical protein